MIETGNLFFSVKIDKWHNNIMNTCILLKLNNSKSVKTRLTFFHVLLLLLLSLLLLINLINQYKN